jgi:hypothetical protein
MAVYSSRSINSINRHTEHDNAKSGSLAKCDKHQDSGTLKRCDLSMKLNNSWHKRDHIHASAALLIETEKSLTSRFRLRLPLNNGVQRRTTFLQLRTKLIQSIAPRSCQRRRARQPPRRHPQRLQNQEATIWPRMTTFTLTGRPLKEGNGT